MKKLLVSSLVLVTILMLVRCGGGFECNGSTGIDVQRGTFYANMRSNSVEKGCMSGIMTLQSNDIPHVEPNNHPLTLLNYEHILTGFPDGRAASGFTPRQGPFPMKVLPQGDGVRFTRQAQDEPWAVSSVLTYRLVPPHYVDFEFEVEFHDPTLFDPDALFFFASYMNWVADTEINFLGFPDATSDVTWVQSHPGQFPGESYIHKDSTGVAFDPESPETSTMNLTHESWPRIAEPFFFGYAGGGSVYALMFDQMITPETEMRFTVMRWELAKRPSPAWDFSWVVHKPKMGQKAKLRGRMIFKAFVSKDDIHKEYTTWRDSL